MTNTELIGAVNECMKMQAQFNEIVNPDWKKAKNNWRRAIWTECAELMDHVKWKWWKDVSAPMDNRQALLEVVDIFHFVMSDRIIDGRKAVDLVNSYIWASRHTYATDREKKLKQIEELATLCLDKQNFEAAFFQVVFALEIKLPDLLKYYLGKNALNKFRQDNGYKEGTYVKMWNAGSETIEDNVALERILDGTDELLSYETIYEKLSSIYNERIDNETK